MSLILALIIAAIQGLFVGALARLALPGRDPMSLLQTAMLGIAAGLSAMLLARLVFEASGPGFLLTFVFAVLFVYLVRRSRGGGLTSPGGPSRTVR